MTDTNIGRVEISLFYGTISHVEGLSVLIGTCRRPYRLSVRTQASQAWKPGSIPGRVTRVETRLDSGWFSLAAIKENH